MPSPLILASASPRRQELLGRLGLTFTVHAADIDEAALMTEGGPAGLQSGSRAQGAGIAALNPSPLVIGADTIVVVDNRLLGKPDDDVEARSMLALLRERAHFVVTGVALVGPGGTWDGSDTTRVWMRGYSQPEVEASIARGDPFDKAGGYAIQDPILRPVRRIEGCRCNVIGLPLAMVARGLGSFGLSPTPDALAALPNECMRCFGL
jgi:MAF protein